MGGKFRVCKCWVSSSLKSVQMTAFCSDIEQGVMERGRTKENNTRDFRAHKYWVSNSLRFRHKITFCYDTDQGKM